MFAFHVVLYNRSRPNHSEQWPEIKTTFEEERSKHPDYLKWGHPRPHFAKKKTCIQKLQHNKHFIRLTFSYFGVIAISRQLQQQSHSDASEFAARVLCSTNKQAGKSQSQDSLGRWRRVTTWVWGGDERRHKKTWERWYNLAWPPVILIHKNDTLKQAGTRGVIIERFYCFNPIFQSKNQISIQFSFQIDVVDQQLNVSLKIFQIAPSNSQVAKITVF